MNNRFIFGGTLLVSVLYLTACKDISSVVTTQKNDVLKTTDNERIQERIPAMVTLPSGLKYEIIKEAQQDTQAVAKNEIAEVHYTGWLDEAGQQGKKFDSSRDRGQSFRFVVDGGMVIKGWDLGVEGMKVGEVRRLYIPFELGYGTRGAGNVIPPRANLIFDVELLSIQK